MNLEKIINEVFIYSVPFWNRFTGANGRNTEKYYIATSKKVCFDINYISVSRKGYIVAVLKDNSTTPIGELGFVLLGDENFLSQFKSESNLYNWIKAA